MCKLVYPRTCKRAGICDRLGIHIYNLANRGSNLPQVVATDFFLKMNIPVLAETPVTQRSSCYSAVSATLMNPLPDCSNYSPFFHNHYTSLSNQYFTILAGQTLYQTALLLHCYSAVLQNLVGNSCLRRITAMP